MSRKAMTVVGVSIVFGVILGLAVKAAFLAPTPGGQTGVSARQFGGIVGKAIAPTPKVRAQMKVQRQAQEDVARTTRMTTYQGTIINPEAIAVVNPQAARMIATAFATLDPQPPARRADFQWAFARDDLNIVGWMGHISRLEAAPDGWLVEIHVRPKFEQPGGVVMTSDKCIERWKYTNGQLQPIPFPHDHAKRGSLLID